MTKLLDVGMLLYHKGMSLTGVSISKSEDKVIIRWTSSTTLHTWITHWEYKTEIPEDFTATALSPLTKILFEIEE
jgi:GMP synthase-like glutamine amidotransferase